jgi:hypothetical protein
MKINEITNFYKLVHNTNITEIKQFIKQNCSQILSVYKANPLKKLYRGLHVNASPYPLALTGESPTNRKPQNTPIDIQNKIDNKLKEAGFSALRSNSIFCSSVYEDTESYGAVYIIYPFNGFTYTWAENIYDLTLQFCLFKNYKSSVKNDFNEDLYKLSGKEFVDKYKFRNTDLNSALNGGEEICIHGKYLALLASQYDDIDLK